MAVERYSTVQYSSQETTNNHVVSSYQGSLWLYSELMLLLEVVGIRQVGAGNLVRAILHRW
jgi:hypothetical protein